ncbi:hypothetical protein SAMN05660443_0691 [Marinospirillum celere]|uniref:Uncharacterized protein n=1 Tax=Marinospirillum celere TaxID=1122252 RepID=A0A1I1EMW8_9GAMM|nr:hypothetical protein [Marinospirillum celere]SFB88002.1 hypothetical protein SAMN05660443_0691 [Marinospirillum celere]
MLFFEAVEAVKEIDIKWFQALSTGLMLKVELKAIAFFSNSQANDAGSSQQQ